MEVLLGQLYLPGMPAVPRLRLPCAAPLPPDDPCMALPGVEWQPAGKVAVGGTQLVRTPYPQQRGPTAGALAPG